MRLVSLSIPDDPAQLAGWLEQHLVGLDLAALVAELHGFHGRQAEAAPSLEQLLGDRRDQVLERGLSALPPGGIRQLLRSPELLLELQELVLCEGGRYWEGLPRPAELTQTLERTRRRLFAGPAVAPASPRVAWYRRPWVVSLATAAAVLLVVELPRRLARESPVVDPTPGTSSASTAWGWDRPGALPGDGPAKAYLTALADAAEDWFKKRPEEPAALARRLEEFRHGCTTLIFAEHRPLAPREREWLVERCRLWGGQIDRELADLEAGSEVAVVRGAADEAVRRLVEALRGRAGMV